MCLFISVLKEVYGWPLNRDEYSAGTELALWKSKGHMEGQMNRQSWMKSKAEVDGCRVIQRREMETKALSPDFCVSILHQKKSQNSNVFCKKETSPKLLIQKCWNNSLSSRSSLNRSILGDFHRICLPGFVQVSTDGISPNSQAAKHPGKHHNKISPLDFPVLFCCPKWL